MAIKTMWQCTECEELHARERDANECCPKDNQVWVCDECEQDYPYTEKGKQDAMECCPDIEETSESEVKRQHETD